MTIKPKKKPQLWTFWVGKLNFWKSRRRETIFFTKQNNWSLFYANAGRLKKNSQTYIIKSSKKTRICTVSSVLISEWNDIQLGNENSLTSYLAENSFSFSFFSFFFGIQEAWNGNLFSFFLCLSWTSLIQFCLTVSFDRSVFFTRGFLMGSLFHKCINGNESWVGRVWRECFMIVIMPRGPQTTSKRVSSLSLLSLCAVFSRRKPLLVRLYTLYIRINDVSDCQ